MHVWAPGDLVRGQDQLVSVHGIPDFGMTGLRHLSAELDGMTGPKRLFVQYVAPAFGMRGVNLPFCLWLGARAVDDVWIQFHEVAHGFRWGQPPRYNALALVQWFMAQLVAGRADRLFISVPGWRRQLGRSAHRAEVLPIPSNVPEEVPQVDLDSARLTLGTGPLVGHFGTYGRLVTALLEPAVVAILRMAPTCRLLLLGRGGPRFASHLSLNYSDIASRVLALGFLEASGVSAHLAACDLLIQPYPDGISGRRTSAMAGLALGKPIVTTIGYLTEDGWSSAKAVELAPVGRADELAQSALGSFPILQNAKRASDRGEIGTTLDSRWT